MDEKLEKEQPVQENPAADEKNEQKEPEKSVKTENTEKEEKSEKRKKHDQSALKKAENEIKKLEEENKELDARYLRLLAEYDNFKKRTVKEKEELSVYSKAEILKELLPVFDNLDRARGVNDLDKLREGGDMILTSFESALNKLGISEIPALGKEFDPNLHEAVFHEDKEGEPENTISEVLQKGYIAGEKVIRHALVKVVN